MRQKMIALCTTLSLITAAIAPAAAQAASYSIPVSTQSLLNKTNEAADKTQSARLSSLQGDLAALLKSEDQWNERILSLHTQNEETLPSLRQQIQQIGLSERSRLEQLVTQTKAKYQPLFQSYTTLNDRIQAARALKNKELNALLRIQADSMKAAVQLARADIRAKEEVLRAWKSKTAETVKKVRSTLKDMDPIKVQIRAEKSILSSLKKQIPTASRNLTDAVKVTDAKRSIDALTSLTTIIRDINAHQQKIIIYEQKISDILSRVKSQIPVK
ncbi:hypothetical protein ACFQZR_00970 [Paenibacillus sp. GCM10027629]|uniref:hypothetical protein n=1 Tax=Paenibacillus sp. GCM10027629 TaxID=3273414 RepID=UPI0036413822